MGEERSGLPSTERVSVPQAADHLGTTVDAIRKRVHRGTIPYERDEQGRVWILLDTGRPRQDATGHRQDTGQPQYGPDDALISEMREHIEDLREQLEAERQAHAEARRLLLSALEKIPPAIEAPSREARERPVSAAPGNRPTDTTEEDAHRDRQAAAYERRAAADERQVAALQRQWTDDTPDVGDGGPQSGSERPWWRRMFGG